MALQVCTNDLVPHAVGMPACPECGCTTSVLQDSPEHEALLAGEDMVADGDGDDLDNDDVPDGTIDEVLAWVGEDQRRALQALTVEQAGKARRSLMDQLGKVFDGAGS